MKGYYQLRDFMTYNFDDYEDCSFTFNKTPKIIIPTQDSTHQPIFISKRIFRHWSL